MKIEFDQKQMTALIEHLGALSFRYEAEAAAYASLGETGREIAAERLKTAGEAHELQDYLLSQ